MRLALALAMIAAIPGAALAQPREPVPAMGRPPLPADAAVQQIVPPGERSAGAPQLSGAARPLPPPGQLTTAAPSAEGAAPLSTPDRGRTGEAARIGGHDQCDRADAAGAPPPEVCRRALESRAGEFEPPSPTPLTPEQRLLVQQGDFAATDPRSTARRLADGQVEGDLAAEAVAVGAADPRPQPEPPPAKDPAASLTPFVLDGVLGGAVPK